MDWSCLIFLIFTVCQVYSSQQRGSSRQENNVKTANINAVNPFRMNKLNLMWEKAKKTVTASQLPALYAEFIVHDRLEIEWKKQKAEGGDEDGRQEAVIHHKFLDILDKFGLRTSYPEDSFKKNWPKESAKSGLQMTFHSALNSDPKLAKLWQKAEAGGFSDLELNMLKEEFGHHADKIDEYQQLKAEIDRLEGVSQNSIERFKDDAEFGDRDRSEVMKEKHSQLKSIYRDVKQSYSNLERLTEQVASDSDKVKVFTDPRVRELWGMALKANLSEEELSSFKTELGHFEHRINKYNHFDKEAQMLKANHQMRGKDEADLPESHSKLNQKVQDYAVKVKKWYTELKNRILKSSVHTGDEF